MSSTDGSNGRCGGPELHEIRVQGHLDARWAESLEGMVLTLESGGVTALTGAVTDQAALHGLLAPHSRPGPANPVVAAPLPRHRTPPERRTSMNAINPWRNETP